MNIQQVRAELSQGSVDITERIIELLKAGENYDSEHIANLRALRVEIEKKLEEK